MRHLTDADLAHARMLAEIEVGILEPYFVDVPDGHYTRRWVPDGLPEVGYFAEDAVPTTAAGHYEPCRIPRFRKELRYRRTF